MGEHGADTAWFDKTWPEGWVTHPCPAHDGKVATHSRWFHDPAWKSPTPHQADDLVATAVSDRADLEAENERLRAALKAVLRVDPYAKDCRTEVRRIAREALEGPK